MQATNFKLNNSIYHLQLKDIMSSLVSARFTFVWIILCM